MTVDRKYYLVIETAVFEAIVTEKLGDESYSVYMVRKDASGQKYNHMVGILKPNYAVSSIGSVEWKNIDGAIQTYLCFIKPTIQLAFSFLVRNLKSELKNATKSKEYFEKVGNLQKLQDKI
jgi:hypothetical protein